MHALDDFEGGLGGLRFLDRDHAFAADLLHGLGDQLADDRVVVRGDRGDLRLLLARLDRPRQSFQVIDGGLGRPLEATFQVDGAGAGHHVAHAVGEDGVRQDDRRAGAVAHGLAGLLGGLPQHLRTQVLFRVRQVEFLGDGDAVVAHERRAPLLLDQHGLGFGPSVTRTASASWVAPRNSFSRATEPEQDLFVGHGWTTSVSKWSVPLRLGTHQSDMPTFRSTTAANHFDAGQCRRETCV